MVKTFFTKNIGLKIFALFTATVLWFTFSNESEIASFVSAQVEYRGVPQGTEISSEVVNSVFLELQGKSGRIARFAESKPTVVLDFTTVRTPGYGTFQIDEDNLALPRGIRFVRSVPAQLSFRFERTVSRLVPVAVRFASPLGAGLRYSVNPVAVKVVGPESRISHLQSAVTDPIEPERARASGVLKVHVSVADEQARIQGPVQVEVRVFTASNGQP